MTLDDYPELLDRSRVRDMSRLGMDRQVERPYLDEIVDSVADRMGLPFAVLDGLLPTAQVFLAGRGPIPAWIAESGGTPVEWAFCRPMLRSRMAWYVRDFTTDPIFQDNPLVTIEGVRSYIGAPLISSNGHVLGGLCGLDLEPRAFGQRQLDVMRELADEAVRRIEAHAEPDIMEP